MKNRYLILAAAIIYFFISVVLLTIPGSNLPKEDWLDKIWFDKWVHIGMFTIMVWIWCFCLYRFADQANLKKIFIQITIAGIAYGIGMEFVQKYFIPHRSFDTGDIIADTLGSLAGLFYSWGRYIKK